MDPFQLYLLQEEQYRLMTEQSPRQDGAKMLEKGFLPMITMDQKDIKIIWGELINGKMVPSMMTVKNVQGVESSVPVPFNTIFVGRTCNAQLSSMGNVRNEDSFPMTPSQIHKLDKAASNNYQECKFNEWDFDTSVDLEANEILSGFSKSRAKQGMTLVCSPNSNDFDSRTILNKIYGKRGLILEAIAYFASQPENRAFLSERFNKISRGYTVDDQSSIYRAIIDELSGQSNGHHFSYEDRGGALTLPVYSNLMFELSAKNIKKDRDGKRIKPDNEKYLKGGFDPTSGLQTIFKKFYRNATYRYLKKTDLRGQEIGFLPGEQKRCNDFNNPVVAVNLIPKFFFNGYGSLTLSLEPDHDGVKILYDGDPFTASELATLEEWKRTGNPPSRFQVNIAMAADLSNISELAKSEAMQLRRDEFFRTRGGDLKPLAICDAQAEALLASIDEEDRESSPLLMDFDDLESDVKRRKLD
jgi:hypothetical protein